MNTRTETGSKKKVWFITGASKGFGLSIVKQLLCAGHFVAATSRDKEALAKAVNRDESNFLPLQVDLANESSVSLALQHACEEFGRIDVVINNAGYGVPGTFDDNDWKTHQDFIRVMIEAPAELAWLLLPAMRARGYGRIINVASLAGHVPAPAGHAHALQPEGDVSQDRAMVETGVVLKDHAPVRARADDRVGQDLMIVLTPNPLF